MKLITACVWAGWILITTTAFAGEKGAKMTIQNGKEVAIHYTLKVDGQVVDTSAGRAPLVYTEGQGQIIPGLSEQLVGLKAGDKKSVQVSPEKGYGLVNPKGFQEVSKTQLPKDIKPQVGMILEAKSPDGRQQPMRITEVKETSIVVDMNHPLAGKTLNFDIEVISVK